jgi:hypothetical protein
MPSNPKNQLIKIVLLFGLAAGILAGVNAITSSTTVGKIGEELISYLALLGIAAFALGSGVIAARISKRPVTGLWIGLLVGVIASLIATASRIGYSIAFYNIVRNDPVEIRGWIHRGSASFVDYLIADRIGGFINSTLSFGFICAVLGMSGGLTSLIKPRPPINLNIKGR